MKPQSLEQAKVLVKKDVLKLRCGLAGCPVGGWPQTEQAMLQLANELPHRSERTYSVSDFVEAIYEVDHAGRYQVRPEFCD